MNRKKAPSLVLMLLFLTGFAGVLAFRVWQVKKTKSIPFSPRPSSFTSQPPSEALKGTLVLVKGKVEKVPKEKDEFEGVGAEEEILQGEKLATGARSQATVDFQDFSKVDLGSNTEIGFINLIPSKFLISQPSGSVVYKLLQDHQSFSVRSLHALLNFSGECQLITQEDEIAIKVVLGQAKLALVDLDNKTRVWALEKGDEALVDDRERTVEISKFCSSNPLD